MRATMSRTSQFCACQWWTQPNVQWAEGDEDPYSGTTSHEHLAHAALGRDAPDWAAAACLDLPAMADAGVEAKVALDLLSGAGQWLQGVPRDYRKGAESELCGTADLWWMEDGVLVVADWKTGPRAEYTESVQRNGQLAALALAIGGALGHEGPVRLELRFAAPDIETCEIDAHETSMAELRSEWMPRLRAAWQNLGPFESGPPVPVPGVHCGHCPAKLSCPETRNTLAVLERSACMSAEASLSVSITSPEQAASVYSRLKLAKALIGDIGDALKRYVAEAKQVDVGGGKVIRVADCTRTTCALTKVPAELRAQLEACGAVNVSMYDQIKEYNAVKAPRVKRSKANA